ncbi:tetratricopeptide repeat protein [Nodosilinea nodulosa]|uniref:tetratricopeptide repeat protein n=1 Tax=Nodosilinea nodulosa TaxID=416001 RepID=UPI0002EE15A9|nr:tetratricopeptide repeat protein [Nodosilinea nodulosa]
MKFTVAQSKFSAFYAQPTSSTAVGSGSFRDWYAEGESQANAGAYDRALRCFEEAIILAPDHLETLIYQAVCLIHLEQPERALAVADQVLAIAPNYPQGWLYRGVALHRLGRYKESYASYARATPS